MTKIELSQFADHHLEHRKKLGDFKFERRFSEDSSGGLGCEHVYTNVPHKVVLHSPTGFEWGYAGSGPADLALNILETVLLETGFRGHRSPEYQGRCFDMAIRLHQDFKDQMNHWLEKDGGTIPFKRVLTWIQAHPEWKVPDAEEGDA